MAEVGARQPADETTAARNVQRIMRQDPTVPTARSMRNAFDVTARLRQELRDKGIQGFKRGGRVHRTGIYKLHRGERVIPARSRRARRR